MEMILFLVSFWLWLQGLEISGGWSPWHEFPGCLSSHEPKMWKSFLWGVQRSISPPFPLRRCPVDLGPYRGMRIGGQMGCPKLAAASEMGWVTSPGT